VVRPTHAEINLSAIEFNLAQVREIVEPGVRICPAVKADAYGHGAVQVSRLLVEAGVEMLGVAFVEEAVELRDEGIGVPILLLQPAFVEQIPEIVRHDLAPTVCDIEFARELSRRASGKPVKVHLKVDTGMGRVGIQPEDTPAFAAELSRPPTRRTSASRISRYGSSPGSSRRSRLKASTYRSDTLRTARGC